MAVAHNHVHLHKVSLAKYAEQTFSNPVQQGSPPIQKPKLWYLPNGAKHITHFPTPSMETHERGRVQIFARLHAAWTGVVRALERARREEADRA